jgi:hypothetical protein
MLREMADEKEKEYNRGVDDGQRGTCVDDVLHNFGHPLVGENSENYKEGYEFGAAHRFNEDGERFHTKDHSGVNDSSNDSQNNWPDLTSGSSGGGSSSSDSNSDSKKDSGGCYLTTACINARGLPDNCLELMVLRGFRNRILMTQPAGRRELEIYEKIAPVIVSCVNKNENSQKIWGETYKDIQKAVRLIIAGDFSKAFEHYKAMTLRLKRYTE